MKWPEQGADVEYQVLLDLARLQELVKLGLNEDEECPLLDALQADEAEGNLIRLMCAAISVITHLTETLEGKR